jgi:hypothetical protein
MKQQIREKGLAHLGLIIAVIVVVAAVAFGGWYVWDKNKDDKNSDGKDNSSQNNQNNDGEEPSDPYEGWQAYSNDTYGISFKYPPNWIIDEKPFNSPNSATKQEYSIVLELAEASKYNEAINIEVHNETLEEDVEWYDQYFSGYKPIKTTNDLKGRRSVQYAPADNTDSGIRLYLFSVGAKTYEFSSLGSSLLEPEYWDKFNKVFDSLQIK